MYPSRLCLVFVATLVATRAASAGDFVLGIGPTDFDDSNVSIVELEYHTDPILRFGGADISVAGTLIGHDNGDFFVGFGVSALRSLSNNWFLEASFMPGFFESSEIATDLGSELQFRSLIGIGRTLPNGTRVSLGLSHKSNAGLGSINPGVNALSLRIRF